MPHDKRKMGRQERRARDEKVADQLFSLMNECIVGGALTTSLRDKAISERYAEDVHSIADMLQGSDFLPEEDRQLAVEILRRAATEAAPLGIDQFDMRFVDEVDSSAKSRAGAKPILARGNVRYAFFLLVVEHGISKNRARELIAARTNVSVEAVKNALGLFMNRFCDDVLAGRAQDPRPSSR